MRGIVISCFILLFFSQKITGLTDSSNVSGKKYQMYFAWGYNKDWYSTSDIRFYDPTHNTYDFTLENAKAKDRTGFRNMLRTDLTIPQYVYRIGFYNKWKKIGLEINFDHAKYVMINDQKVHVKGQINKKPIDKDTLLYYDFVQFEHTNGANYLMLNALKRFNLTHPNKKNSLLLSVRSGAGICIPKTDAVLFGKERDAPFHVAGYILGVEAGLRYEFLTHFFMEATVKEAFVNFNNVLTVDGGKAKHRYFTTEVILTAGYLFHF